MNSKIYWLLSGEGVGGTWERVKATPEEIKQKLTKERCNGDRWAHAYEDAYTINGGYAVAGYDVETGAPHSLPEEARLDFAVETINALAHSVDGVPVSLVAYPDEDGLIVVELTGGTPSWRNSEAVGDLLESIPGWPRDVVEWDHSDEPNMTAYFRLR